MKIQKQQLRMNLEMIEDFREYLYERENAPSTIRKYISDIHIFYIYLGEEKLTDKKRILEYKEWLTERYAPSSANSMLAALNQFLEFFGASKLKVKRMKIQKKLFLEKEKEISKAEYERIRETARKKNKMQLSLVIETLAVTGARISELGFFTVEKVRLGKVEIFNKGKRRTLLIADGLRKKLLYFASKNAIARGNIFVTRNGKSKDRSNLWREMKGLGEEAGVNLKKIFPHNLRHLFARTYYKCTRDLAGLADLLGHSSMDVTRIYTAETGEAFQRQIALMGLLRKE